jgi:TrmH family RNA methyltransferase
MLGVQLHCTLVPPATLTSEKNPLLRDIRRARGRGALTDEGFALAEGPHLLEEAAGSKVEIGAVIVAESAPALPRYHTARVLHVADSVFAGLSSTESPQGVLALVRPRVWTLEQVLQSRSLLVVLDGVQDPGNAGAILRAAEAFGASGVVLLKGTVNPYNPKCMRGSAGSVFRLPLAAAVEAADLLARKLPLYAADPRASRTIADADLKSPCALIIGAEGRGVSAIVAAASTGLRIPTSAVESLNAAVAAGVFLYEARRQRGFA